MFKTSEEDIRQFAITPSEKDSMHATNAVESQICDDKELEVCSATALFARRITSLLAC